MEENSGKTKKIQKKENPFISLLVNIVIPALIFDKLSEPDRLGPLMAMGLGLMFPLVYGIWDFLSNNRKNLLSALGILRVVFVGGFSVAQVDGFWFAVEEAAFPLVIGIFVIYSHRTENPLVKMFLYNDQIVDVEKVDNKLAEKNNAHLFDQLLYRTSWLLAFSFFISAVLNFVLARMILESPAGTPEFNKEFAKMTWLSYPVIVVPCMVIMVIALWRLFKGIQSLTGLTPEDILKNAKAGTSNAK